MEPDTVRILWVFSAIHATGYVCVVVVEAFASWMIRSASDAPRENYEWRRGSAFVRKATDREVTKLEWKDVPSTFQGTWALVCFVVALAGLATFWFWRGLLLLTAVIADMALVYGLWHYEDFRSAGKKMAYESLLFLSFLFSIGAFLTLLSTPAVQLTLKNGPWND